MSNGKINISQPSLAILVTACSIILVILISNSSSASAAIVPVNIGAGAGAGNQFCKNALPGEEMALCVKLVNGAKTFNQALTNVLKAIEAEAQKDKPLFYTLPKNLPRKLRPVTRDSVVSTCKEIHQNIVDGVKEVFGDIRSGDPYKSIPYHLSALSVSDCTDGLSEFGVTDPKNIEHEIQHFSTLTDDPNHGLMQYYSRNSGQQQYQRFRRYAPAGAPTGAGPVLGNKFCKNAGGQEQRG